MIVADAWYEAYVDLNADIIFVQLIFNTYRTLKKQRDAVSECLQDTLGLTVINDKISLLENILKSLKSLNNTDGLFYEDGNWYPVTLIKDSFFNAYTKEIIDLSNIKKPDFVEIDYNNSAKNLQKDYKPVKICNNLYWAY